MTADRWCFPIDTRATAGTSTSSIFRLSRRAMLLGSVAFVSDASSRVAATAATTSGVEEAAFLKLSVALTGHAQS
jgi:hypothetical protein